MSGHTSLAAKGSPLLVITRKGKERKASLRAVLALLMSLRASEGGAAISLGLLLFTVQRLLRSPWRPRNDAKKNNDRKKREIASLLLVARNDREG